MTIVRTRVNQSWTDPDTEFPGVLLSFLNDLINDAGWRVLGSGDGASAFENTGQTAGSSGTGPGGGYDVITHGGTGANGFNNSDFGAQKSSWRRMKTPASAPVQVEFIIWGNWQANPGTDQNYWRIEMGAPGVAFDSGGAAGTAPVANGSYFCVGGRQARTGGGNSEDRAALAPGAAGRADWWICDSADDFDFMFQTRRNGIGGTFHCFGVFARLRLYAPWPGEVGEAEDTDPYAVIGILPTADSATGGSWINSAAVHRVQNNPTTPAKLGSRTTQINREGVYVSYGLGTGHADEGHYFASLTFWGESTGGGYQPGLTGDADAANEGLGTDPITGESLVAYNFAVIRGQDGTLTVDPLFYKGTVKTRKLLGAPSVFENPPVIVDSDRGGIRRVHWGFASLPWAAGAAIDGIDAATTTALRYVEVEPAAGPPQGGGTPPAVSGWVPAIGTPLARSDTVQFDVTDDSGLFRRIFVIVEFASIGTSEVVHDGTSFAPLYASSTRTPIGSGFRYVIRRTTGWPSALKIRVFPIDQQGNEV